MSDLAIGEEPDFVLYTEGETQVVVPDYTLASGALQIRPLGPHSNPDETFFLLQKIRAVWAKEGIDNYLVYRNSTQNFVEAVPYYTSPSPLWSRVASFARQLFVLFNVTFGPLRVPPTTRQSVFSHYQELFSEDSQTEQKIETFAHDAFCNPAVIARQCVLSGTYVDVLYNYAPINCGQEQLHFLLVPKHHRDDFNDLRYEEYCEAADLIDQLRNHFSQKGYTLSYQFHKTGSLAGQTVAHWHEHLVFVEEGYNWLGKFSLFFRMLIPPSPLSQQELQQRVERLSRELKAEEANASSAS